MNERRCHDLLNQISEYIDGELAEPFCAELERHLAACPDCQVVVDTSRKTVNLYRRFGQAELPEAVAERLWQAIVRAGSSQNSE